MKRRDFLKYLGIGAASAPVAAKAVEKAITEVDPNEERFKKTIEVRQEIEELYPPDSKGYAPTGWAAIALPLAKYGEWDE